MLRHTANPPPPCHTTSTSHPPPPIYQDAQRGNEGRAMRHDGFEGFVFEGFGFEVFGCLCIHRQGGGTHTHPHPASMHECSVTVAVAKTGCNCVTCMCNQRLSRVEKSLSESRASQSVSQNLTRHQQDKGGGLSHQPIKCSQHVDCSRLSKKAAHCSQHLLIQLQIKAKKQY